MILSLDDLFLRKEELPILHGTSFHVPIHPLLLSEGVKISPLIPRQVFPIVAWEWFEEFTAYCDTVTDEETREWYQKSFLSRRPSFMEFADGLLGLKSPGWKPESYHLSNGFAHTLCIERSYGGSLYFNQGGSNYRVPVLSGRNKYVLFSEEKARAFCFKDDSSSSSEKEYFHVYAHHNVEYYPGALFLRNWAVECVNKALRQVSCTFSPSVPD